MRPSFVDARMADSKPREHLKIEPKNRAEKLDTNRRHIVSTNSEGAKRGAESHLISAEELFVQSRCKTGLCLDSNDVF